MNFNEQQKQAIQFHKGACAVIAGAGSGKSTVLVNRIKNLIDIYNVPEQEILAISFTRNTADDLRNKLSKLGYLNVNVGTFHSICGKILTQEDKLNRLSLIKEWQVDNCFKSMDDNLDIDDVYNFIKYQKNYNRSYTDEFVSKESQYSEIALRQYYKAYESFKQKEKLYDFEDYLTICCETLENLEDKYNWEYVLVDEHQDSNLIQNLLLKKWCKSGNIFCVFDYRQAIYSFRGGNTEYCMNFNKYWDNPTIINLDMNYRSSKSIVHNANKFIKQYYGNYEYYSDSIPDSLSEGFIGIHTYSDREAEGIEIVDYIEDIINQGENLNEIGVLYRINSHVSYVENELKKRGIDYEISNDSSFFKRKEIAGIMSYLRLINNPHDDSAFETVFKLRNYPLSYFSNSIYNDVRKYAGQNNLSMYESFINMKYSKSWQNDNARTFYDTITKLRLQIDKGVSVQILIDNIAKSFQLINFIKNNYTDKEEIEDRINSISVLKTFVKNNTLEKFIEYVYANTNKKKSNKSSVKLMSVHSSKGLEFKHVFLIGIEDGKFPHDRSPLLDEARLFYVGVTRAKENLWLSQINEDNQFIKEYISK